MTTISQINKLGYCYNDLKLENIILDEARDSVFLIDFG